MAIKIIDWSEELSHVSKDSFVGIKIATLIESEGKGTFVTIIPPGNSIVPHYHKNGNEEYHIISGEGVIRLLPVDMNNKNFKLVCKQVKENNSFLIPPNVIHQLINNGKKPLTLIFSCPVSHLQDDRYIINNLEDKIYDESFD